MKATITLDPSAAIGGFRPLHGVNKGPTDSHQDIDVSHWFRTAGIPSVRLHDCSGPTFATVDHHAIFPNPLANPANPESYDFSRTDRYVSAVLNSGCDIIYRLGESIEHDAVKRRVNPPHDLGRWAQVCLGIIRHYNEGWADGFHHGIRYWEIWNEPDNRPPMWTGTDEQFFALYATATRSIKQEFPSLKVGGCGLGTVGSITDGILVPNEFLKGFIRIVKRDTLPLDFFSWHHYTNDPGQLQSLAHAVRAFLNAEGFIQCESHLNEWNYLADNRWSPFLPESSETERQRFFERLGNEEGASYVAAVLMALQDAPVDMANYYDAGLGGFGLFDRKGLPKLPYEAIRAFHSLLSCSTRIKAEIAPNSGLYACAGMTKHGSLARILLSNPTGSDSIVNLKLHPCPWDGNTRFQEFIPGESPRECTADIALPAYAVRLIDIQPDA